MILLLLASELFALPPVGATNAYEPYRKCVIAQVKAPSAGDTTKQKIETAKHACSAVKESVAGDMSVLAAGELAEAESTAAGPLVKNLTELQRDAVIQQVVTARLEFLDEGLDGQAAWEAEH
jgi:hypothetical protein